MSGGAVWFTSDLHLGHRLVAELRGFPDVESHDQSILDRWARLVHANDQVWMLGDLAVSNPTAALAAIKALPGTKHLITGNHDACSPMHRNSHRKLGVYLEAFASVQQFARRRVGGAEVLLSHFPYRADRGFESRYPQYRLPDLGAWLLHGHTHGRERLHDGREIHVGLDAWDLKPVHLSEVEKIMKEATSE